MPPIISYTKENIIDAAFELYKEIGLERITIRKIAGKLGSSIAPIYSNFKNIDELKKCLMDKTLRELLKYTDREYSNNAFLNIGIGLIKFAKENKVLYKTLFINSNEYACLTDDFFSSNLEKMKSEPTLKDLDEEEMMRILEKVRLFTHGLAALICSGSMKDKSHEYLYELLKEAGEDIMGYTIYKKKAKGNIK
jgi:AcrR family transcriptional regulator